MTTRETRLLVINSSLHDFPTALINTLRERARAMREVVIAGVGLHKFGRFENKTFEQMGQEAILMALKDANNMPWKDIQMSFCGTMHGGTVAALPLVGMSQGQKGEEYVRVPNDG